MICYRCEAKCETLFPIMREAESKLPMVQIYVCKDCYNKELNKQ